MLRSPFLWATLTLLLAIGVAGAWLYLDPPPVAHHAASITDDETVLERAEAGYKAYLATRTQILQEGGADPARIENVAAHALSAQMYTTADTIRDGDYHYTGGWTFTEPQLVNRMIDEYGRAHVILRGCLDATSVVVISNADGSDITNEDWTDRRDVIEVTLVTMDEKTDELTPYSSTDLPGQECAPLE